MPSLHRVAQRYWKEVTPSNPWPFISNNRTDVACAFGYDLALFCADFHSISLCSVYEFSGKVLKFAVPAARKIDVVGLPVPKEDVAPEVLRSLKAVKSPGVNNIPSELFQKEVKQQQQS